MLDRVVSAEKYAAQHFLSGLNALSNNALTENYGWVQNVLNDKHETDTQIGSTLNSALNTAYNVTSTVSNLDTNKILSGLNAGWEGTKKGIDSGFNKLGNWAVEYKANAGNAYSSANFVDLSKNAKDVIDIASSVTGIGAINKVNKVKKAAEAAHKLSDDLVDLGRLNQSNNINKLDDARDLTKTVPDIMENNIIYKQSGARITIETSLNDMMKLEQEAIDMYDKIRLSTTDVKEIAQNTGLPEYQISRIKNHVFIDDTHLLLNESKGRFAPDIDIADSWKRLENGTHNQMDLMLLQHEYFESKFEKIFKVDADTAHRKTISTNRVYNP